MNVVGKEDEQKLAAALERLSSMDLQQMKQTFLRGLQSEVRSARGGAGLGLLEMARRSGNPLRHAFTRIDDDHTLFGLQVLVGSDRNWLSTDAGPVGTNHQITVANGVDLLCRGVLPAEMQENLLRMIERDLNGDPPRAERAKHAFLLMLGGLADVVVTGEGPMVVVAARGAYTTITVAAPLGEADADRSLRAVEMVNAMDAQMLQRRYRDILLGRSEPGSGLELSLMDLARRSTGVLRSTRSVWRGAPFVVLEVDV